MLRKLASTTLCAAGALLLGSTVAVPRNPAVGAEHDARTAQGETLGFVLSNFGPTALEKNNCPEGINTGLTELLAKYGTPEQREVLSKRPSGFAGATTLIPDGPNKGKPVCANPTLMESPKPLKVVQGTTTLPGLDLDGLGSLAKPQGRSCAHQNFKGADGREAIDNQLYRVMGCTEMFQGGGPYQANMRSAHMSGAHTIVIEVTGVNDRKNDSDVGIAIYSSRDATPFAVNEKPLPYGSFTVMPDKKFWGSARGRIVNGVLTSDTMDVRLFTPQNSIETEQAFREARLQMTLKPDGTAEGLLAGYRPIDDYYFNQVAMRNTRNFGDLAAGGYYSCRAMYDALHEQADGLRNPQTGKCEGISTALVLNAVPAYVVK